MARPQLALHGDAVEYKDGDGNLRWRTPASAIVLIAEYTTSDGPWCDDYFLIFWSWEDGRLFRSGTTLYADGMDEVLADLSRRLQCEVTCGLADSTDWKSRIIWPPELVGHPYFTFVEVQPTNWRERLSRRVWGPPKSYFASDEVCNFLRRYNPEFQRQP